MNVCGRLAVALLLFSFAGSAVGCDRPAASTPKPALSAPSAMDVKRSDMHRLAFLFDALEREGLKVSGSTTTAEPGVFDQSEATYYAFSVDDGIVRFYLIDAGVDVSALTSRRPRAGAWCMKLPAPSFRA